MKPPIPDDLTPEAAYEITLERERDGYRAAFTALVDAIANPSFPLSDDARILSGLLLTRARWFAERNDVVFIPPRKQAETIETDSQINPKGV